MDLSNVKLLVTDVDGVLTDGKIYISDDGGSFKSYSIYDGLGLKLLMDHEIRVVIISSSKSESVRHRANSLGIENVYTGIVNKSDLLKKICTEMGVLREEVVYVGDDLVDLKCMDDVGYPIAVKNAVKEVKLKSVYITSFRGGEGAIREVCEIILKAKKINYIKYFE